MSKFSPLGPAARARIQLLELVERGGPLGGRLRRRLQAQKRASYCGVLGLAAALVSFVFCAVVSGHRTEIATSPVVSAGTRSVAATSVDANEGAVYVHRKLVQVRVASSGAPVLRLVECRHYSKGHMKLVQVGMADGHAVLSLVPGDHCLLGSGSGSGSAQSGSADRVEEPYENLPKESSAQSRFSELDIEADRFNRLTPYQRYACEKFGPACRVALAIQLAENAQGNCEVYHYNSNGTLDWGFFQINSVHLTRRGLNLRDLLDCKANIDFAYQLFREEGFEPWVAYVSGAYRRYLFGHAVEKALSIAADRTSIGPRFFRSGIDSF
jgi:hypothetical protein